MAPNAGDPPCHTQVTRVAPRLPPPPTPPRPRARVTKSVTESDARSSPSTGTSTAASPQATWTRSDWSDRHHFPYIAHDFSSPSWHPCLGFVTGGGLMSHADPLFPARPLLPLGTQTGFVPTVEHRPARLRPFSATLGRPMPVEGK